MTERSSREIERDIAETRSDLRETIDAIQDKLSPGQLVDQMLDYFRHGGGSGVTSGASEFAGNLGRTVRRNPVPVALLGVGLTWLMLSSSRDQERRPRYADEDHEDRDEDDWAGYPEYGGAYAADDDLGPPSYSEDVGGAYAGGATAPGVRSGGTPGAGLEEMPGAAYAEADPEHRATTGEKARDGVGARAREAAGHARHAAEEARQRAARFTYRAGESAAETRERFGRWAAAQRLRAERLGDRARRRYGSARRGVRRGAAHASDAVREQADRARGGFNRMLNEQPLVVGAAGLAIGALLGAALPPTRREDEWLGETRDDLLERAEEAARQEWDRAQRIAERVIETVRTEAEREGISREGAERGLHATEERLRRVAEAARSEAEQQGLSREGIDEAVRAAEDKLRRIAAAARDAAKDEATKRQPGGATEQAMSGSSGETATGSQPTGGAAAGAAGAALNETANPPPKPAESSSAKP